MNEGLLSRIFAHQWTVLILTAVLLLVIAEVGFRVGLRLYATGNDARKRQIGGIQGAVLGLLGLLLGFTFAIAGDQYDRRRTLVLQEANGIGTTYLRAGLLPEAHQAPVKDLLRRYVDLRLKYQPLVDDPAKRAEGMRMSAEIQAELWKHAAEAAKEAPNNITAIFIESLNETIDSDAERIAAMRAHIPGGVWLLLVIVAAFGCVITGYGAGADAARTALSSVFLPLMITLVIVLIFDLSHPRQGLIRVSQQPLLDLQQSIQPMQRTHP
jgi:hypothetical protein